MALGSTQPLTEMSTRNLPGGKGWPARKADNLTAICEPIVYNSGLQPGVRVLECTRKKYYWVSKIGKDNYYFAAV
jgi:hypothetical protein